ncbi:Hpt domain-containing protein [bacterium]|nr:Hpt domain-containing protein [bacterium]
MNNEVDGRDLAANVENLLDSLGAELVLIGDNVSDLGALVVVLEKFGELKQDAEAAGSEALFQICFGSEEILSTLLCDGFEKPAVVLGLLQETLGAIRSCISGRDKSRCREVIEKIFETLGVPVVRLPGEGSATNLFTVTEASLPDKEIAVSPAPMDEGDITTGLPESFDDPDLYREFVLECAEHLETIEEKILALEESPEDTDLINEIFRPIHSMKGGAGFLSLVGLNKLAHDTETLLDRCRKGQMKATGRVVELSLASTDALKHLIGNLQKALDGSGAAVEPVRIGPIRQAIQALLENPEGEQVTAISPEPDTGFLGTLVSREELADPANSSTGVPADLGGDEEIEFYKRFVLQCAEHLENVEGQVLKLEQEPGERNLIDALFREVHSIKGDAAMLHLSAFSDLAHETETLLDRCRKGELPCTSRVIDLCLRSMDALRQMNENLQKAIDSPSRSVSALEAVVFGPLRKDMREVLENPARAEEDADRKTTGPPRLGNLLVEAGEITRDDLEEALSLQDLPIGEILVRAGKVSPDKVRQALQKQVEAGGSGAGGATARTVKVDTAKIDDLINLVGELVIIEAQVAQMADSNDHSQLWEKNLSHLDKITKELQDRSMSLRMTPIRQTFQKMTRLVRDSSKKVGKKVNLVLSGEDTELDKTVVEQIGDPLVHMLRNCVDHGIETPEDRIAAGKPEAGEVHLDAFYQGDRIVIRVTDDGGGLDRDRILAKAIENGLLPAGASPPDKEVYDMIFQPGFSTAKEITEFRAEE